MTDTITQLGHLFLYTLPIQGGIIAFFLTIERFIPAGPHKSVGGLMLNLKIMILSSIASTLGAGALEAITAAAGGFLGLGWIDLGFSTGQSAVDVVLGMLLFMLVYDFFFYWFHRFQHEINLFWQEHKLHHMDEQLNVTSTARHNWFEGLLEGLLILLPMTIVFKLNSEEGAIVGSIIGNLSVAYNFFIHSNLKIRYGAASILFGGPQYHRIHHSRLPEHHDKNYAASFPIWDWLFGTYYHPGREEFPPTGVHDEKDVGTLAEAAILPIKAWWKMFRAWGRHGADGHGSQSR